MKKKKKMSKSESGKMGIKKRLANTTPEELSEQCRPGGMAILEANGNEYFAELGRKRAAQRMQTTTKKQRVAQAKKAVQAREAKRGKKK